MSKMHHRDLSYASGDEYNSSVVPLVTRFDKVVSAHPDRIALVCMHQPADLFGFGVGQKQDYLRLTYSQLDAASDKLARVLSARGVVAGRSIVTFLLSRAEYAVAYWAAVKLHCPFTPFDPAALHRVDEILYRLRVANASAVIVGDSVLAKDFDSLVAGTALDKVAVRIVVKRNQTTMPPDWLDYHEFIKSTAETRTTRLNGCPSEDDVVLLPFSSGTTSLPKACPFTVCVIGPVSP